MKAAVLVAIFMITTLNCSAQFERMTPVDSGVFFLRTFEVHDKGEVTVDCKKTNLKYYLGESFGFVSDEGFIELTESDQKSISLDDENGKWLVLFEIGENKDKTPHQHSTNQIYNKLSDDGKNYMISPHFQVSNKDICQ